jgi:hypothetical protein
MALAPILVCASLLVQASAATLHDVVVTGTVADVRERLGQGDDVNARDDDGVTPVMRAASAGRADIVAVLLAAGADAAAATSGGVTALMMASLGGYTDAMRPLLERKPEINKQDNQGRTALMAAASSGDTTALDLLLQAGARVSIEDATGTTAITYAAAEGHAAAVALLQSHGATAGETELILAAGRCNTEIVSAFLRAGMAADTRHSATTPLIAAAGGNCADTVGLLIDRGANVDAKNGEGWTPLIKAAAAGHTEIVGLLLARGADMSIADTSGRTAWMYAAMGNHLEMAEMFRRARAARSPVRMEVTSPALTPNAPMPRAYTADGRNVSPPLAWSAAPGGTRSIAIVCDDAESADPAAAWMLYNVGAAVTSVPENDTRAQYRGPAPPRGAVHHYRFSVYALDLPELPEGLTRDDLLTMIKDHVLGQGELVVTYERR